MLNMSIPRKSSVFETDARWQNVQHRKLIDLAKDPDLAQTMIEFMDDNPAIKDDLSGIYSLAKNTLTSA